MRARIVFVPQLYATRRKIDYGDKERALDLGKTKIWNSGEGTDPKGEGGYKTWLRRGNDDSFQSKLQMGSVE